MPHKLGFRVIHVSGQDESYKATELNAHSPLTKGWQSSRFCLYPQDIVLQFESRSRLKKIQILAHQYLIPTKIEFFIGDVPDDTAINLQNARYTRLGYVALSDNEKTGFKARELKSVHVDANGFFLKLNIHKNHINKFNLYNQVGIVAVNVIGDPVKKHIDITDPNTFSIENKESVDDRPDWISPLDDLAFDMYQDAEVAQIIRKLENKKQEAVLQERYDYAKRLKAGITELQKVGEKLGKFEVEKRQAVENEDYDKAQQKKALMDDYRMQKYRELHVSDLLEAARSRQPQPVVVEPYRQPTPPRLAELSHPPQPPTDRSSPSPRLLNDDRPLPALKKAEPTPQAASQQYDNTPVAKSKTPLPTDEDELDESEPAGTTGITGEPEPMTEKDSRDASAAIEVFGLPVVSKAYSKTWSYREDSLLAVYKVMKELDPSTPKEEAKAMLRAAVFLCRRAILDKVYAVFKASQTLLSMILVEFVPTFKISRHETAAAVDKTLPNLLQKSGDTAQRNREDAKKFIQEMAKYPEVKLTHAVPLECIKVFKVTIPPKLGLSRTEIVEILYKDIGLSDGGLSVENTMKFCTAALQHNAGEVREASERIIKALYRDAGAPVKEYLPHDDEKTRKNTLYRMLFEYFDKVDGKPSKSELKKQKVEEEAKKQAEIDALQKQLQDLKDMSAGKVPIDNTTVNAASKKPIRQSDAGGDINIHINVVPKEPKKADNKPKGKAKPTEPGQEADDASTVNIDNVCIFCGEKNENFTEEGLDMHYWKNCPMLKRCTNCKQVVEIASFTDHQLGECNEKNSFSKCPRCTEAIPKAEYEQHIADKSCNPTKSGSNHCPLCHDNIGSGEDGWKNHQMGKDGCTKNPRRILALNKQSTPGKLDTKIPAASKTKGKSNLPKASSRGKGKPSRS